MGNAAERKQMMFTHAGESDVPDQHQLIVVLGKCHLKVPRRVPVQSCEHFLIHAGNASRRVEQAGTIRVLAHRPQDRSHRTLIATRSISWGSRDPETNG